jgi:hypothetical protein
MTHRIRFVLFIAERMGRVLNKSCETSEICILINIHNMSSEILFRTHSDYIVCEYFHTLNIENDTIYTKERAQCVP